MKSATHHIKVKVQSLIAHPGARKYILNTGWMFGEKILRLIGGLFVGAYVARYLGPAQFGLLNYVLSLVALFSVVATLGLDTIVIRELVKDEQSKATILGTAFVLRMAASVAVFIILAGGVTIVEKDALTRLLIYIIATGTLFEAFGIIDYFFQSRVTAKYAVWSQMAALVVVSIVRIILVSKHAPLMWFAITYVLDFFMLAAGLILFYGRNSNSIFSWRFEGSMARRLLSHSWPLIFSALAVTIYMRIAQIMIKWMLGDVANGNYGVAVRLCEMWNFIPVAICASLFPAILNAKNTSETLYMNRLQWLYDLMVAISVGIAIPMTFLSGFLVRMLFGDAYTDAGNIMVLYIWSSVFVFLGVANGKWIISENLQLFRMYSLIGASLLNVILNYILIKKIGVLGAAVSTLISQGFASYFSFLFSSKTRPMFYRLTDSLNIFSVFKRLITATPKQ